MNASYLTNENNILVCVVDDELSIRESLSRLLRSAELNVQTLCSAQEFLMSPPLEACGCLLVDEQLPGIKWPGLIRKRNYVSYGAGAPCD